MNDERYLPKIIRGFFKSYEATFGNSIGHVSYNVYRGLPLYKKNQLDKFVAITESDYDFIYIFMKGHYRCILGYTEEGRSSFPGWVEKYYVKNDHIVKFDEYFDERNYVHDDDRTIQLKRTDFRKFIGEKDVSINTDEINESLPNETFFHGDHDTKLMRIQKEVLNRYYGNQFDVTDRGTWSKQSDVVAWVRQEYNLTEREAMAVDMVTRPDQARGK